MLKNNKISAAYGVIMPNLLAVMSTIFITLYIVDSFNPFMYFMDNSITPVFWWIFATAQPIGILLPLTAKRYAVNAFKNKRSQKLISWMSFGTVLLICIGLTVLNLLISGDISNGMINTSATKDMIMAFGVISVVLSVLVNTLRAFSTEK